jgi:hypothetical protein
MDLGSDLGWRLVRQPSVVDDRWLSDPLTSSALYLQPAGGGARASA